MNRILIVILLSLGFGTALLAQGPAVNFQATTLNSSIVIGDTVDVEVTASSFVGILYFQYTMEWDPTVLELIVVENCNADIALSCVLATANFNKTSPGVMRVSWFDAAVVGKDLDDNASLYTLKFKALSDGDGNVQFTDSGLGRESEGTNGVFTPTSNPAMGTTGASVIVGTGGNGGGNAGELTFTAASGNAQVDDTICIAVTVENFDSIIFFQYTQEWDANVLELIRIDNCNSDLGLNCNLGQTNFNETTPGVLRVSWLDAATVGKPLADGSTLYELCFKVKAAGSSNISFTGSGLGIEGENPQGGITSADITVNNGTVTTTGNGGGNGGGSTGELTFTAATGNAQVDDTICIAVTVENFDSIIFFQYTQEWDANILELIRVDNCNSDLGLNCNLGQTNFNETTPGVLRVSWLDAATVGKPLADGSTLYELCFKVKAAGSTSVSFTGSGLGIEAENPQGGITSADITVNSGTVTTTSNGGGNGGGSTGELTFTAATGNAQVDDTICIAVTVENFDSIIFFQYTQEWDANILELIRVDNCNSDLGLNCNLGQTNFNETTPGVLRVSWLDAATVGKPLADGSTLYELCFKVKAAGSTSISFTGSGLGIEAENPQGALATADISVNSGTVTTTSNGGGNGGGSTGELTFTAATGNAQVDDTICIAVTVENFDSIIFFQYTQEWDANILELIRVDNCNSDLGLNCNLGQTNFNETTPGVLRVSWLDAATVGKPLADGSTLYELCFKVKAAGSTSISFTGSGLGIEAENPQGALATADISVNSGTVTTTSNGGGNGGGSTGELTFTAATGNAQVDDTICIAVTVENFDSIIFFQYTQEWDANILELIRVDNCNSDLGLNCNLGQTNFNETTPGVLRVSWLDAATVGKPLADGSTLYELCFKVKAVGSTNVSFTGSGLGIEAENPQGALATADITVNSGTVTTTGNGGGNGGGNTGELTFTAASGNAQVDDTICIAVTVENFDSIIFFQYTQEWDANILELIRVDNCNSDLGLNCNLGQTNFNETTPGVLRVSWLDAATVGKPLADGSTLYELCFKVKAVGSTNVSFTGSGLGIEAENPQGALTTADITVTSGTVTTTSNGGGNGGGNTGDLTFTAASGNAQVDDTICVAVTVQNFDSIIFFQYTQEWDANILELIRVDNCNSDLGLNCNLGQTNFNETTPGILRVSWLDAATVGKPLADGSTLYELCFKVIAVGSTNVSFTGSGLGIEAENPQGALTTADITVNNGAVTATSNGGGGNPDELSFTSTSASVDAGATTCLGMMVENFNNITSFDISQSWDASALELVDVTLCNSALTGINCTLNSASFTVTGNRVDISWTDPSGNGVSIPDGDVLFDLCFRAIGISGEGSIISFVGTTSATNASGTLGNSNISTQNGEVTITGTSGTDNLSFIANGMMGNVGDTVCLSISTEHFNDIIFYQYTMEWDSNVIELISLDNCNSDIGLNCNLGQTNFNQTSGGSMRVSWLDPTTSGQTLANGSVLHDICFKIVGGSGENSLVRFTNSEIGIEAEDGNGAIPPADIIIQNGFVSVMDNGGSGNSPLVFNVSDGLGIVGDTVCVAVSAENFDDIIHFQNTIEWNSGVLQFIDVMACNSGLTGLNCTEGPNSTNFNLTGPGSLRVSWFDPATVGLDIPDAEPLFLLCFKLVGNAASASAVNITGSQLDIEASNPNGDITANNIIINNGTISIVAVMPVQSIEDIRTTDILCNGVSTGAIDIDVVGGVQPLTYTWSNGASTQDLINIPAGKYDVTITDANNRIIISPEIEIFEPAPIAISNMQITLVNSEQNIQGAIDISVSGGSTPYSFAWSNGLTSEDIDGLTVGCYTVTITDRNNCQFVSNEICVEQELVALSLLSAQPTDVICTTDTDGSIAFSFQGGMAPFTFSLSNGTTTTSSLRSGSFDGLSIGQYTVVVTDAENATITTTATIEFTTTFFAEGGVITSYNGFGVSGSDKMDGIITATPNSTVGPYTYEWSNSTENTAIISNVGAGTYSVTITDGNGCQASTSITVIAPQVLESTVAANLLPSCNEVCDGEASVSVSGGVAPFEFLWSTGASEATIFDLCEGTYSVTITDANSISTSSEMTVVQPDSLTFNFESQAPSTIGGIDGSAAINVDGGSAPYQYQWNDSNSSTSAQVSNLTPDTYFVIVTDANGCQKIGSVIVENPTADCFETRSIITIDGDGLNENFVIQCVEQFQTTLEIFNRWGQLVFEAVNYDNGWSGTDRRGNQLPEGGYFYVLKVTQPTGEVMEEKGHLTILTAE